MKYYEIKLGNRAIAYLYTFFDFNNKTNKKEIIDTILDKIPYYIDIGYAGFKSKDALKKHLYWAIFGSKPTAVKYRKSIEKQSIKIIRDTIIKCNKVISNKATIKIFLFSTYDSFVKKRMLGSVGYCFWKNSILLYIHADSTHWKKTLANTICHEYAHSITLNYHNWKTLLDGIIFDGLAENFREVVLGGESSPWSKAINKTEAKKFFDKLKGKLNSRNRRLYAEVFYGGKKYPLWAGYSIGYYIVKNYISNLDKIDWFIIFKKNPRKILEKSGFAH